jgi:UDP-glucose 4-epimerase
MKVLITGGAGYIGSHVVTLLGEQGHDLVVLDNFSTGRRESLFYGNLVEGDLSNHSLVERVLVEEKIDAVMHFAGSIIVPESVEKPHLYYQNNTENSLNLIRLCVKTGIKKFIFSSTAAVYGISPDGIVSEQTPTSPINPYGRSKLMTEWMLEDTAIAHDFDYVALRYFNVAGAHVGGKVGQCSKVSTHLLKIACEHAIGKRDSISIYGEDYDTPDGTCLRDYIHVDDLAQAHLDALTYLRTGGKSQVLNCGYGEGFSVKEMLAVVERVSGLKLNIKKAARRAGDAPVLVSKAEKIREILGWEPKYNDLDLIVKTALEWERKLS